MINLVALEGHLARPAQQRVLPSGSLVVNMELTVRRDQERAETVPLSWPDAPVWASTLDAEASVIVVGRVRRRFFKAGGATQSRTEVVVATMVPLSSTKRARAALAKASAEIEAAAADLGHARAPQRAKRDTPERAKAESPERAVGDEPPVTGGG
jgi:single-strand DNA-binding protein